MYGMDQFENELKELRIVLSDVQKQQFEEYYKLLVEWNEVMNLTAITDLQRCNEEAFFRQSDGCSCLSGNPDGGGFRYRYRNRRRFSGNSAENCISADSTDFTGFFTKTIEDFYRRFLINWN